MDHWPGNDGWPWRGGAAGWQGDGTRLVAVVGQCHVVGGNDVDMVMAAERRRLACGAE